MNKNPFLRDAEETKKEQESILGWIDFQICLMQILKRQMEAYMKRNSGTAGQVQEPESSYSRSGYMADVELDEKGAVASIRYDWVEE